MKKIYIIPSMRNLETETEDMIANTIKDYGGKLGLPPSHTEYVKARNFEWDEEDDIYF